MKSPWLPYYQPRPDAWLRLFCFPYAGGGATVFHPWTGNLLAGVDVCAVQLPGRETRLAEPRFPRMDALIESLASELRPFLLDGPCAFFGHSMGALIAFELARHLANDGLDLRQLFVSARPAAHIGRQHDDPPAREMSTEQLVEKLRRLSGTPESILANQEIRDLMLPIVRSDFELLDEYHFAAGEPLNCPLFAYGGLQDEAVTREHLAEWKQHTRVSFCIRMFPGNHFYLQSERSLLLQTISRDLVPLFQTISG